MAFTMAFKKRNYKDYADLEEGVGEPRECAVIVEQKYHEGLVISYIAHRSNDSPTIFLRLILCLAHKSIMKNYYGWIFKEEV